MSFERIPRKPRIKWLQKGKDSTFWCFYHKRFFNEGKKFSHCIPKQCYEFDHDYYLFKISEEKPVLGLNRSGSETRVNNTTLSLL